MGESHAVSRRVVAIVAGASIVSVVGLAGCQPEQGQKTKPESAPTKPGGSSIGRGPATRLAQKEGIPESGVELGWGWDTRTGSVVSNRCVEFAPVQATGQRANLSMQEVSDKSDVMDSLGVSASVSVSAIFGASGSAHASFARQSKVSSTSTSLLLRATIDNGVLFAGPSQDPAKSRRAFPSISADGQPVPPSLDWKKWQETSSKRSQDEVALTSWASDLLRKGGINEFTRHCGDAYVSAIYGGAELLAITTFASTNKAQKEKVTAALKAQYGVVQASANASKERESTLGSTNMDVSYMQVGGGSGILPTTRDQLVKKLEGLATEAAQHPKFHSMEITPYDQLASWPADAIPTGDAQVDDTLSNYYWSLTSLNDDIQSILDDYASYWPMTGLGFAELQVLQDEVNRLRADIYESALLEKTGGPVQSSFRFQSKELSTLNTAAQTTFSADWVKERLLPKLEASAPQKNVNALRLKLPLPKSAATGLNEKNAAQAVVEFYVGRQSKRICARNPSDSECLSNEQLKKLEADVRMNFPTRVSAQTGPFRLRNIHYGLCLTSPDGKHTSPLVTAMCDPGNMSQRFLLVLNGGACNVRLESGAVGENGKADKRLVITARTGGILHTSCTRRLRGQSWAILDTGHVTADYVARGSHMPTCLESGTEGEETYMASCVDGSYRQKWKVIFG
jgi:hypothetical protein